MLHRYAEAEKAWNTAQQYPAQPGADATAAILYAAMGNAEKTAEHINSLKEKYRKIAIIYLKYKKRRFSYGSTRIPKLT